MGFFSELGKNYSKAAEPIVKAIPGIKWAGQSPSNFWTGIKPNKVVTTLATVGLAGYAAVSGAKTWAEKRLDNDQQQNSMNRQDVGQLAATKYEGTGGGRSNLGATGDLVFGLHNKRKG